MNGDLPLLAQAQKFYNNIAIVDDQDSYTYGSLLEASNNLAFSLLEEQTDLQEQRVAFLVPPGFSYVAVQWGIWRSGGIAVPLCMVHPKPELEYVISNAQASILVGHPETRGLLEPIAREMGIRYLETDVISYPQSGSLPPIASHRRALILYTSGTTGKPKGVVTTHSNITAQIMSLVTAWEWTETDRILHVLPLHHIHGIINVLSCALWAGATCYMLPKFAAETVWEHFVKGNLTLFMAVPTIYVKLINYYENSPLDRQAQMSAGCAKMRLMVSGSAALPVTVLEQWQRITGHFLLERYGMTEIGMALSNPLHGHRRAGFVGTPLPGVGVRLCDEAGEEVPPGSPGEIQVRGPGVFLEYWQKPEETAKSFRQEWFCTGDLALWEGGAYRILGRQSVDIIKTGGYKVSSLEIEEVLRTHPQILDCAVVGIPDREWGERVAVALVLRCHGELSLETLRSWAKERLAAYKVPSRLQIVPDLPRNALGKVTKPAVAALFG